MKASLERRVVAATFLVAAIASSASYAAAWGTNCSEESWVGGTVEWCDGALIYRDYVYDDTGADRQLRSPHGTQLNPATGDVDHRSHGQALNSADLLTLRLRVVDGQLHVRFDLNTLFPTDGTMAALAIDYDPDEGGGPWGSGIDISSTGHDVVHVFTQRDTDANVIEGSVSMPPIPPSGQWRVQAVTALGDGTVMNVAFRGTQETGSWWEGNQSAALATGDISDFGFTFDVADLVDGNVHAPATLTPGFFERVYASDYTVPRSPSDTEGEGVDYGGVVGRGPSNAFGQSFWYLGRHQPYGIYIPAETADPYGLQLALHGYNANHRSLVGASGMQGRLGDDLHRIVVVPLGRGPQGYYSDYSERDVLDVIADVEGVYPVDPERRFSGGYSMGGYGSYRMSALHPDLFAGAIDWVGFTGDCVNGTPVAQGRFRMDDPTGTFSNDPADRGGCPSGSVGNIFDYLDNLRWVPTAMLYSAGDELVWASQALALQQRWAALGYEHVLWLHAGEHLTLAILDQWQKEAAWTAGRTRVTQPSHVTYRTNPWLWSPDLGIRHDRAYWVSGIRTRDLRPNGRDTLDAVVDLTSAALPSTEYAVTLEHGAGVDPVPWVSQEGTVTGAPAAPASGNRLFGTLENVDELTIDVQGAGLDPNQPIDLSGIESDGETTIHFVNPDLADVVVGTAP